MGINIYFPHPPPSSTWSPPEVSLRHRSQSKFPATQTQSCYFIVWSLLLAPVDFRTRSNLLSGAQRLFRTSFLSTSSPTTHILASSNYFQCPTVLCSFILFICLVCSAQGALPDWRLSLGLGAWGTSPAHWFPPDALIWATCLVYTAPPILPPPCYLFSRFLVQRRCSISICPTG